MTRDSLLEFLEIKLNLKRSAFTDDTPLFTSGLLDSMALVDLINFLESSGNKAFNALEMGLENLNSVGKIVGFMEAL